MATRTPEEMSALDAKIKAGIYANKTIKQIASELGQEESYLYTIMRRRLDVEKGLLFPEERAMIRDTRAAALKMGSRRK